MSGSKKTRQLMQRERDTLDLPTELVQDAASERSLIVASSPFLVPVTPPADLVTYPTRHTHCRCLSCQRRRARKRAARKGAASPQELPYINAVIISVVENVEAASTEAGSTAHIATPAPGNDPRAQAAQTSGVAHALPGQWTPSARTVQQPLGQRRKSRAPLLLAALLLLFCGLALAWYSGIGSALFALSSPPQATITIIPRAEQRQSAISITAVTGRATASQVAARWLSATQPTRTVVARSTGNGQTAASTSQGTLYFYNGGPTAQTIGAGTSLTGADGITVVTSTAVTVPAGNPPATYGTGKTWAQSVQTGSQANIAAGDIGGLCCAVGISVKNTAFGGGQDAQSFPIIEQSDIDAAARGLEQGLIQQGQRLIEDQVPATQQLAAAPQCSLVVHAADAAGSRVAHTSVSVSLTCTGEAFDRAAAQRLAASIFAQQGSKQLGANYRLVSSIRTAVSRVGVPDQVRGTLTIIIQAQGTWVYQFGPDQRLGLARRIEGKPISEALTLLAREPGVQHISVQVSAGTESLPADASRISIVILPFQSSQAG